MSRTCLRVTSDRILARVLDHDTPSHVLSLTDHDPPSWVLSLALSPRGTRGLEVEYEPYAKRELTQRPPTSTISIGHRGT